MENKNLNTNSRNEPHNQETIPNTPLVIVEHEEEEKKKKKKKKRVFQSVKTYKVSVEKLNEVDQWRWEKHGTGQTGKEYYKCNEVEDCPARRHVEQSSKDPNKVIVTYRGEHNHLPPNQENKTETIPNTPLVIGEHEEKNKRARYSEGRSSSTGSGKALQNVETYEGSPEELNKADQWRWKKHGTSSTGTEYYRCDEVEYCPVMRQVVQSSFELNKVIVTYIGKHNHPPPNQQTASPNAAAPVEDPSFPSTL